MMQSKKPLSERLRPKTLDDFIGQEKLVGKNGLLTKILQSGDLPSIIFWGPPASGKTTLARLIAAETNSNLHTISAVIDGKNILKKILDRVEKDTLLFQQNILFIDEIHRWNKSQQDALLPYVEDGTVTLLGATTENPSFTINSALLSRSRVMVLEKPNVDDVLRVLKNGQRELGLKIQKEDLLYLACVSGGDMRFALNTLAILAGFETINKSVIDQVAQKSLDYDRDGEQHYTIISAVHKSLRSSNPDAALYWVFCMLRGGEDPLYVVRRLIRFASEDIGNANPNALLLANEVYSVVKRIGMPECDTAISQLVQYLGDSPKSNSAYKSVKAAYKDIETYGVLPVPLHFRNSPTKLMRELGYGRNYEYDPELLSGKSHQQCFPETLRGRKYY